jgi:hypothetical protein
LLPFGFPRNAEPFSSSIDGSLFLSEECGFKGFSFGFPGNEVTAYVCQSASAGPSRSGEVRSKSQIASLPARLAVRISLDRAVSVSRASVWCLAPLDESSDDLGRCRHSCAPFECLVRPMSISGTVNYVGTASTRSAPKFVAGPARGCWHCLAKPCNAMARQPSVKSKYSRIAGYGTKNPSECNPDIGDLWRPGQDAQYGARDHSFVRGLIVNCAF